MKWFKHDSMAHNDEKMREIIHEFGSEGYGVYMVVLELVAEKIDDSLSPLISISDRVLREKCRVSHQKLTKILRFFDQKTLIYSKLLRKTWEISCPNMLNRLDNWTKKQSSYSVVTTSQVPSNQNQNEIKKEKKEQESDPVGLLTKEILNGFKTKELEILTARIEQYLKHPVGSEANNSCLKELLGRVHAATGVKDKMAYAVQSIKNWGLNK